MVFARRRTLKKCLWKAEETVTKNLQPKIDRQRKLVICNVQIQLCSIHAFFVSTDKFLASLVELGAYLFRKFSLKWCLQGVTQGVRKNAFSRLTMEALWCQFMKYFSLSRAKCFQLNTPHIRTLNQTNKRFKFIWQSCTVINLTDCHNFSLLTKSFTQFYFTIFFPLRFYSLCRVS